MRRKDWEATGYIQEGVKGSRVDVAQYNRESSLITSVVSQYHMLMANPLDTLLQKVRSNVSTTASRLFGQAQSFVQQNPTPAGFLRKTISPPIQQGFNTIGQEAGNYIRGPVSPLPNVGIEKIINPVRQYTGNLVQDYIQKIPSKVNSAINLSPVGQLEQNTKGKLKIKQQLGDIGNAGTLALDIATLPFGGSVVKNVAKDLGEQGVKYAIKEGAKSGAGFGAVYGGLEGLFTGRDQEDIRKYVADITTGTLAGGAIGGVAGGALGGVGYGVGKVMGKIEQLTNRTAEVEKQLRNRLRQWVEGNIPKKPKGMPLAQWDFQLRFNEKYGRNPYTPVYPDEIKKAFTIEAEKRIGFQARPVGADVIPPKPNVAEGRLMNSEIQNRVQQNIDNGMSIEEAVRKAQSETIAPTKPTSQKGKFASAEEYARDEGVRAKAGIVSEKQRKDFFGSEGVPNGYNPRSFYENRMRKAGFSEDQINKVLGRAKEKTGTGAGAGFDSEDVANAMTDHNLSIRDQLRAEYNQSTPPTNVTKGRLYDLYHGGNNKRTLQDYQVGAGEYGTTRLTENPIGMYFAEDEAIAKKFGKEVIKGKIPANKVLDISDIDNPYDALNKLGFTDEEINQLPMRVDERSYKDFYGSQYNHIESAFKVYPEKLEALKQKYQGLRFLDKTGGTQHPTVAVFDPKNVGNVAQPPIGDINSKIDLERSINQNVQKIQKDFLDGKITIEQRKALAEREFARSTAQPPVSDVPSLPQSTGGEIPKTVRVWRKRRFSEGGSYIDVPVIRKEENITLYQGGNGEKRQFWTPDKKYAEQFGQVKEKTGTFYEVDNGNRVTNVYVEVPSSGGEIGKGVTKGVQTPLQSRPLETTQPSTKALLNSEVPTTPKPVLQTAQIEGKGIGQNQQSLDSIISEGRKKIKTGGVKEDNKTFRQVVSDLYTQWVDRYNPIVKASQQAKQVLKTKGASLRPEYDPEYLVRRLTGAGGIADQRFQTELKPIIDQVDQLKINKLDLDTYLANKRIAGFGTAGRDIYGADPKKAQEIVGALEAKYGENIKGIAEKLYAYQDKGLSEMSDFISPEAMSAMKKQNPDYSPLYRAMDDASDYLGLPTRKTMQGSQPFQKIKGSTRQIESPLESIIGNTFTQRAAIEKNRVAKAIVGLQDVADLGFKKVAKSGNDTITVWKNGKKEFWQVGADIADVAKGVNEENMNLVLKVLQAPAALLRQGATGRNPEFMLPNIIRDQLDAGITSKYGYIPFVDFAKGVWEVAKKDINNKFNTNFDTSLYDKWANSGAKIDLGSMSGKKSITAMFNEKTAKKGLFSWLGKGLDVLGKYSEQPTRVGLFKKAYQKTGNELLSAMESRDATVDFARMGSKMKVANSIIPFLNVGVQGFDKLIRAVKDNPGKVAVLAGIYGAAPQIASTVYNLQNFPQEYAEVPQYEKDSNFVFIKGRNERGNVDYITIPKGNVIPAIANPVQSFLEYAYGVDGQSFGKMAMSVLSDAVPVLSPGGSAKEIAIKTIGSNIPQAIKPVAETLLNKSFYKYDPNKEQSKDIVPSYLQNRPAYKQTYEFTPQMYQKIGAVLNASPLKVQNIMEGYLAGYSKIPAQIIDMMTKVSRGENVETNDKTILRRFIKETYPSSAKPAPTPIQSPSLMERITGKVSASDQTTKPLEEWQIQDEKYKLKQSDKKYAEVGNTIFYKKSNGDIGQADISKTPEKPTLTGQAELDKKLLSSYYSDVTSQANDIVDLYEVGKLTAQEANTKLTELKALKSSGKSKKAPKVSMARIKMPKLKRLKSYKPKKIKIKKIKLPKIKLLKAQRV